MPPPLAVPEGLLEVQNRAMNISIKYVFSEPKTGRLFYRRQFPPHLRELIPGKPQGIKRSLGAKDLSGPDAARRLTDARAEYERLPSTSCLMSETGAQAARQLPPQKLPFRRQDGVPESRPAAIPVQAHSAPDVECPGLVISGSATLPLNGIKLAEHRRNFLVRFRIGTKLHPIPNDAGQVTSDLMIRRASLEHLENHWRVAVILVHGFGDAPHADRIPSPKQDNLDHAQFGWYVHDTRLDRSTDTRHWGAD
jgi:hypothetical protein